MRRLHVRISFRVMVRIRVRVRISVRIRVRVRAWIRIRVRVYEVSDHLGGARLSADSKFATSLPSRLPLPLTLPLPLPLPLPNYYAEYSSIKQMALLGR